MSQKWSVGRHKTDVNITYDTTGNGGGGGGGGGAEVTINRD